MGIVTVLVTVIALDLFAGKAPHIALGAKRSFFTIRAGLLWAIHSNTGKM
jgi:hypothetical protein